MKTNLYLPDIVGKGYGKFWNCKKRYRVVKGSRASKKSTTIALNIICRMMEYPLANTLVLRKTERSLKNSCFAQLRWAINRLGVQEYWRARVSPLELEYIPTGQKIIFRGLDDGFKITSITVEKGFLCWAWLEEATECTEEDFNLVNESLRGQMPEGYFVQWSVSFNPWSSQSWLKGRFFDKPNDDVLAITTTYECNEFLSDADRALFEDMKVNDPQRYKVAALGEWGVASGQFFHEWDSRKHLVAPFAIPSDWIKFRAMDWGCAKPYCCLWFAVDYDGNLFCYRELYGWGGKPNVGTGETAAEVGRKIAQLERREENISYGVLDSACWAKTGVPCVAEEINNQLYAAKLPTFGKSAKGRVEGANALKQRLIGNKNSAGEYVPAIKFFTTCLHTARTIPMLAHDKHNPETYDTDAEDHCFIAGTLIKTLRGEIPIEEVTTNDEVLTRRGYRKVLVSGMTKHNAKVMTVTFSNGKSLTGTPNHPIFIKGEGFTRLDAVSYGSIIYSASEVNSLCQENNRRRQNQSNLTELHLGVTQTRRSLQTEIIIEQTEDSMATGLSIYIERFGNSTMAKYQKVITFITRTIIRSITTFLILSYFQNLTTCLCTRKKTLQILNSSNMLKVIWKQLDQKPLNGIVQSQVVNGTENTGWKLPKKKQESPKLNVFVFNVAKNFIPKVIGKVSVNIARELVVPSIGEITALMTRQEFVQCAGKSSELVDLVKRRLVAENADISVVGIREEKNRVDVYNLSVDGEHEYFANGVLVHNCVDSIIYACLSRPFAPTKPIVKRRDPWRDETVPSAWTY